MPDITVSPYSILSAIILFTIITLLVLLLSKKTLFIARHGVHIILLIITFTLLRLLLPLDLYWAKVINLNFILVPLEGILTQNLIGTYTVKTGLFLIWAIGTIFFLCYFVFVFIKDKVYLDKLTSMKNTVLTAVIAEHNYQNITVKVSSCIDVPRVWGVFTAHIYLPDLSLSAEEWSIILSHEIQHVKNHDTLIKCLMLVFVSVFWWNPVVYLLNRELDYILELRCDATLTYNYTQKECTTYLTVILKVLRQLKRNHSIKKMHQLSSLVNYSSYSHTKQRFEIVSSRETPLYRTRLCWYFLIFFLFLTSYFFIFQPSVKPVSTYEMKSTCSFILITEDNKYLLYIDGSYYKELSKEELNSKKYSKIEIIKED